MDYFPDYFHLSLTVLLLCVTKNMIIQENYSFPEEAGNFPFCLTVLKVIWQSSSFTRFTILRNGQ